MVMLEIAISKQADTTLRAMPRNVAERVIARIEQYAADPDSLAANVRRLRGSRALRLRVGEPRVIFTVEGDTMTVIKVGPRGSVYR
jgi:mRNA interferase RelE/StbE